VGFWKSDVLGLWVDVRRMGPVGPIVTGESMARALRALEQLEGGSVANADEGRLVGHFWLRDPDLAPLDLGDGIRAVRAQIQGIVDQVLEQGVFETVLQVGIGGSALGPQLLADALSGNGLALAFLDNTDPEGIDRTLADLDLARTLVLVVSKSGGTKETRNAMIEVQAACVAQGLDFASRAVAVTGVGSKLDDLAVEQGWLARFPLWDWIGGRFSVTSVVGMLPAALSGRDVAGFLAGAAAADAAGRGPAADNPAVLLAASWFVASQGNTRRAMVVLPYLDRLSLLAKYLQQLVMESLGKRLDRQDRIVNQGLTVYGNKGSTDQHAYMQQLLDGPDDHFVVFVTTLEDGRRGPSPDVEPGVTSADYLRGFMMGTRRALSHAGHPNLTLVLERMDAFHLGVLIALYERAVGLYAELIDVNAYHQPGVEAGKEAAAQVLALQAQLVAGKDPGDAPDDDVALIRAVLDRR
jgi:glucose-6-phosphate isomerase